MALGDQGIELGVADFDDGKLGGDKEAVERAKESARFGGGAEARVLLGDAYFKLERFDEAKKAYTDALKLDPNNRVAGQGLRLVEGQ